MKTNINKEHQYTQYIILGSIVLFFIFLGRVCFYFLSPPPIHVWSQMTWTTVGYGDFRPIPDSRVFTALEALAGIIFISLFIAGLIHCANNFSISSRSS